MAKKTHPNCGSAVRIIVFGVVQGVGFRPFVYRLARKLKYSGYVKNIGAGVEIHLETSRKTDFKEFLNALEHDKPPLAQLENIAVKPAPFAGFRDFIIRTSREGESFVFISPDISTCPACFKEVTTAGERRFHYPFTNCTDCGPRYTIVKALPYDRRMTTMARFPMCEDCAREYGDPRDRRYHAQPIACPACGPRVTLHEARSGRIVPGGIPEACRLIKKGMILAVKGLGGFHLICDPLRPASLGRLRKIKERERKPLALMAFDLRAVAEYAHLSPAEKNELASAQRPIVLLRKKKDIPGIAPGLNEIGFMLPYTPLHYLLLEQCRLVVATSSNRKDAPIIKDEKEGISGLCDYRLTHDRPIHMRSDDSVLKVVAGRPLFLRRGRGFVPHPQKVPRELLSPHHVLALGAELKDTVSIYKNGYVVTSQFLGDLDDYQNFRYFKETLSHLLGLFDIRPQAVVSDLHPHFHTTRFARKLGPPHFQVQHHFAHCLAPLLEHQVPPGKKVLGVALDGYGYGEDGLAWGGEFLIVDYTSYERFAHFQYVPLPGGDRAAKQPWRMALSYLYKCFGPDWPRVPSLAKINPKNRNAILEMLRKDIRSPLTSSCGRLFDAVSFLLGLSPQEVEFEAEAAIRLEAAALPKIRGSYRFAFLGEGHPYSISFRPMIRDILKDLTAGVTSGIISARFHNTLGSVIAAVAEKARREFATDTVVFVGGCFLNKVLLAQASKLCQRKGLTVLRSVRYSPNDESISLGQIAHALARLKKDES